MRERMQRALLHLTLPNAISSYTILLAEREEYEPIHPPDAIIKFLPPEKQCVPLP